MIKLLTTYIRDSIKKSDFCGTIYEIVDCEVEYPINEYIGHIYFNM